MGVKCIQLKYKRNVSLGRSFIRHLFIVQQDLTFGRNLQTGYTAQRCCLTAPGFTDDPDLASRAARWLRQLDFRGRTVVAGLTPPDVELHAMELPPAPADGPGAQQRQAARWETERLMSFEEGTTETDYWPLPTSKTMSSTAIGVASARSRVESVLSLCKAARLDCARVDASSCALARFGVLLRGLSGSDEDVWSVLDLGARLSRLIVCVGEAPVLARVFEYGGVSWTSKLAASLSVSEETAERHKRDHGIAQIPREARPTANGAENSDVLGEMICNVIREDLEVMVGELERSYRYALQCFPGRRPGPLILTGGGAGMQNLDALLAEKLGIEVVVPTVGQQGVTGRLDFRLVRDQLPEPISGFACAIGLAVAAG